MHIAVNAHSSCAFGVMKVRVHVCQVRVGCGQYDDCLCLSLFVLVLMDLYCLQIKQGKGSIPGRFLNIAKEDIKHCSSSVPLKDGNSPAIKAMDCKGILADPLFVFYVVGTDGLV